MAKRAVANVQQPFFPMSGDRVIVMGRWVLDCGHNDYHTELHPLTFLAWSHVEGNKTIVGFYYNPYRVTQRYNPDGTLANKVNDTTRLTNNFSTSKLVGYLVGEINRLQDRGPSPYCDTHTGQPPLCGTSHLDVPALLEANRATPSKFKVCAPDTTSGSTFHVKYDVVDRPGVTFSPVANSSTGCAVVAVSPGTSVTANPHRRTCSLPWAWLDRNAANEGGVDNIDLQGIIRPYLAEQYQDRIDDAHLPTEPCYDPLAGPAVQADPTGHRVRTTDTVSHPIYGQLEVYWTG
jgi:hypothetical protein